MAELAPKACGRHHGGTAAFIGISGIGSCALASLGGTHSRIKHLLSLEESTCLVCTPHPTLALAPSNTTRIPALSHPTQIPALSDKTEATVQSHPSLVPLLSHLTSD